MVNNQKTFFYKDEKIEDSNLLVNEKVNLPLFITNEDYIGKTQSTDADGDVSYCDMYNIRELKLGDYTLYNIEIEAQSL